MTLSKTGPAVTGPVVIAVMDGIGLGQKDDGDAFARARSPNLDRLIASERSISLRAHGTAVGLPSDSDMGNSEVGHNALGAGRVFDQGAKLVDRAIRSKTFRGEVWARLRDRCRGGTLHLLGLLSDGNVHSHIDHLLLLIDQAATDGLRRVRIHVLLDGRDVEKTSALKYLEQLASALEGHRGAGRDFRIASGGGRQSITMDRYEADWSMVERGWNIHVRGDGRHFKSAREAVETLRGEQPGIIDQALPGFVIVDKDGSVGQIQDGDAVLLFNFRGDRMLEITSAFESDTFDHFDRTPRPDVEFAGITLYDGDTNRPSQ